MKKALLLLSLLLSLLGYGPVVAQTDAPAAKMSVNDRLTKARAAKAEKRSAKTTGINSTQKPTPTATQANLPSAQPSATQATGRPQKALPADYKSPVDKSQHGPNGEVIYTGARGAKYYINKNGNKTYLSSNL